MSKPKDDLISRSAAIEELMGWVDHEHEVIHWTGIKAMLECLPGIDAVPVVRCKDCKHRPVDHRDEYNDATGLSIEFPDYHCPCQCEDGWYNWYPEDYWFCADGERRDDDATLD